MSSIRNAKVKRCDVSLPPLPKPSARDYYTDPREREIRELATTWVDEDDAEQLFCDDEPSSPPSSPRKKKKEEDNPEPEQPVAMTEEELEDERELEELRGYLLEVKSGTSSKAVKDSPKPPPPPKPKPGKFQGKLAQMRKESRLQAKEWRVQADVNRKAWRQENNKDEVTEAELFGEDDAQSSPPSPSLDWD